MLTHNAILIHFMKNRASRENRQACLNSAEAQPILSKKRLSLIILIFFLHTPNHEDEHRHCHAYNGPWHPCHLDWFGYGSLRILRLLVGFHRKDTHTPVHHNVHEKKLTTNN